MLWHILDPQHPSYSLDLAEKYYDEVVSFFGEVDRQIGEIIDSYNSAGTVFVISDHGFCKISKSIDLNTWLFKEGYIKFKKGVSPQLRFFMWKRGLTYEWLCGTLGLWWGRLWSKIWGALWDRVLLLTLKNIFMKAPIDFLNDFNRNKRKKWLLSLDDVDWSRTRAYCKTGLGQIFINLKGREPEGMVSSGEEYESLKREIIRKLQDFMSEITGGKEEAEIYAKEEIYHGDYFDEMPDITFLANKNGYQAGSLVNFGSNHTITDIKLNTGHHHMNGIFIGRGETLKEGVSINGATIMDVTPTILYLMGCKIPKDMDGKVLKGIFKEAFLEKHPIEFMEPEQAKRETRDEMSPEDQKKVLERLRNLGYID